MKGDAQFDLVQSSHQRGDSQGEADLTERLDISLSHGRHLAGVEELQEHSDVERAVVGEEDDWLAV